MKKLAVLAALLLGSAAASSLMAQGTIRWGNFFGAAGTARVLFAPIYGVDNSAGSRPDVTKTGNTAAGVPAGNQTYGGPLLVGTGFTVAIYVGGNSGEAMSSLNALGTTTFLTAAGAGGLFNPQTSADPNRAIGTTDVNVQLRAWDNQMGTVTSWAQVMAAGGAVPGGSSDVFVLTGGLGGGTIAPPQTLGLRSFQLTQVVPEPSLIALGALGLGGLLLRRRK